MLALVEITPWHWIGFISCVLIFLSLDLGLFHRRAHVVTFREALSWTIVWFCLAMVFAFWLKTIRGQKESLEFLTGYLIEISLSMDNVFVMALIFAHFRVPAEHQHRVLFWGILGALIMRGLMIGTGVALVYRLHWVLFICGLFLIYTGIKTLFVETEVEPEKNRVIRWARKFYPVTPHLEGQKFTTRWQGKMALTPLALVLLMVETTDLVFAVDSIPAIFAVTTKPFIVFTSNVFAILGLRTLYFVLADAIGYFWYLKVGLSVVLVFIGVKMLLDPPDQGKPLFFQVDIPISMSLMVVAGIILSSMILSVIVGYREKKSGGPSKRGGGPKADLQRPGSGPVNEEKAKHRPDDSSDS
ncbi:MAG TPA: TerC family protein [Candidatus Binatia bacterium]|nr:TerC family protein [Candidatus Binatia bacterium]